jgi:hypothetical protein
MKEAPEELFFDSHLITDVTWAGLLWYLGVTLIRVVIHRNVVYYEFECPSEDWKIYEAEWASPEPVTVEAKAFANALGAVHNLRGKARNNDGEWINKPAVRIYSGGVK